MWHNRLQLALQQEGACCVFIVLYGFDDDRPQKEVQSMFGLVVS